MGKLTFLGGDFKKSSNHFSSRHIELRRSTTRPCCLGNLVEKRLGRLDPVLRTTLLDPVFSPTSPFPLLLCFASVSLMPTKFPGFTFH